VLAGPPCREGPTCSCKAVQRVVVGIDENLIEPAILGFAGEERNAARLRIDQVLRHVFEHGDTAGDMKATDAHLEACIEKSLGDIHGAWELIGLHTNQCNERFSTIPLDLLDDLLAWNAGVCLVDRVQNDIHVGTENLALAAIVSQAIEDR
jgi:hypothetical protein